jgi:hypothetical protein
MPELRPITITCPACHEQHVYTLDVAQVPCVIIAECPNPHCQARYSVRMAFDVTLIERKPREWFQPRLAE